jgi:hypothetical protein
MTNIMASVRLKSEENRVSQQNPVENPPLMRPHALFQSQLGVIH